MTKRRFLWSIAAMVLVAGMAQGVAEGRPHIGINMDAIPLGALLAKHLRLDEGQGIRIDNIAAGSPAEGAGLERDDIIIELEGKKIGDIQKLIEVVQSLKTGDRVSLKIIHLGQRKEIEVTLAEAPEDIEWKYPPEPQAVQRWQPGKVFRLRPGDDALIEIPWHGLMEQGMPPGVEPFKAVQSFHYAEEGKDYTITIKGNPHEEEARVIVEAGDKKHEASVGDIEALPEKYRRSARDALAKAREASKRGPGFGLSLDIPAFQNPPKPPQLDPDLLRKPFGMREGFHERIEKQMQELRDRIKELERERRSPKKDNVDEKEGGSQSPAEERQDKASEAEGLM